MSKIILFPIERRRPDIKKGKGRVEKNADYLRELMKALGKYDDKSICFKKAWEIINDK